MRWCRESVGAKKRRVLHDRQIVEEICSISVFSLLKMYLITQLAQHLPPHMHMRWSLQKLCRVNKQQWRPVKFSLSRSMYWWAQGGFKVNIVRLLTCLYFLQTLRSNTSIYFSFILSTHKACISHLRLKMKKIAAKPISADNGARKSSRETLEMIKKRHHKANWIYCATNQVKRTCTYMHNGCIKSRPRPLRMRRRVHTHAPTRPVASEWVMRYLSV